MACLLDVWQRDRWTHHHHHYVTTTTIVTTTIAALAHTSMSPRLGYCSSIQLVFLNPFKPFLRLRPTVVAGCTHNAWHKADAHVQQKPQEGVQTESNDRIGLKAVGRGGSAVQFRIKRNTPLSKLRKACCGDRQGLSVRQIGFQFDGQPISETDTAAQLEMEAEDTMDVFQRQTGGVC
uniref:LOW QUALITY PROTEIN: small ubiquitin-related modifier 3-like n=1 Tax=Camelus bactrianus TaxID=9837 RepID=A0A9W3HJS8_CAMBA|nr:LOW QUALITY PROTEIN: small ubiquitin-related modifier 3-like [Camelus bactrianus]